MILTLYLLLLGKSRQEWENERKQKILYRNYFTNRTKS